MWLLTCLSKVLSLQCLGYLLSTLRDSVVHAFNALRNTVVEVPVDSALIIGAEETLWEILNHLRDDEVGVIGICGMGGIGKTALLREINNRFFESKAFYGIRMFDVVIWATVSRQVSIPEIQEQIRHRLEQLGYCRLRLSSTDSESSESAEEERAKLLFQTLSKRALSKTRFLLLLDDLWEELDLVKIGIPRSHRNCKVAFTTRSLQVCSNMDADKIVDVKLLDETQSWELFCSKFTTRAALRNPSIQPLARQVVRKCGGLPLALITLGRAMANWDHPGDWRNAIRALDHSAKELQGMDKVISCLKLSYDYLENDKMRSALLSCAMYPGDEDIERKELIDHWFGEGLLDIEDGVDDVDEHIDDVRDRGHVLIRNLQHACLLGPGVKDAYQYVRMHAAVRDMALWINNHELGKVDGFYVVDGDNSTPATMTQSRGHLIRRIWVRDFDLKGFPHNLRFPNICTLRVTVQRYDQVDKQSLLHGFFNFKSTLRVLDLSYSKLKELPIEIGLLSELRYLNLSYTHIESLPKELGGLDKLRQLEFETATSIRPVVRVPPEAIVGLSSLQVVNLYHVGLNWDTQVGGVGGLQLQLNDLEDLGRLQELHIWLRTPQSLKTVLSSDKLCRCTRRLRLQGDWNIPEVRHNDNDSSLYEKGYGLLQMVFDKMGRHLRWLLLDNMDCTGLGELRFDLNELPCLEWLYLTEVSGDQTITIVGRNDGVTPFSGPSLKSLDIYNSNGWKELKFVSGFPSLEDIGLRSCPQMEELTLDDDDGAGTGRGERQGLLDSHFPMLREMNLRFLPALRSIGPEPLLFPSLQNIYVRDCPRLGRLPLGPQQCSQAIESDSSDG